MRTSRDGRDFGRNVDFVVGVHLDVVNDEDTPPG